MAVGKMIDYLNSEAVKLKILLQLQKRLILEEPIQLSTGLGQVDKQ